MSADVEADALAQPPVHLRGVLDGSLTGIRLGVFEPWNQDCAPAIRAAVEGALAKLEALGAELVPIKLTGLGILRALHLVTIATEMATGMLPHYDDHRRDFGCDTRLNLVLARQLSGFDYMHAQRHRRALCRQFDEVLSEVDAIVTPTTGCTAPTLAPDALSTGETNLTVADQIMRYAPAANVTAFVKRIADSCSDLIKGTTNGSGTKADEAWNFCTAIGATVSAWGTTATSDNRNKR
mgnify:CR=1 FL=1